VLEVCCPEFGGGWNWWVIRIRKRHPSEPSQVLHAAAAMGGLNKFIVVVDEDINPQDPEMVLWAMSFAVQPHEDIETITKRVPGLDPSAHRFMRTPEDRGFPPPIGTSGLLIDATRKGEYSPVALPARQFMEEALAIWRDEGLPGLTLREPWHGYPLTGLWTEEDEALARRAVAGESLSAGEKLSAATPA
jgi:3-polyprenyl-4-hydroxybenzoate decarboxylase